MDQRWRSARAAVAAVVALGLGLLLLASPASAEVDGVELGLLPIGQPGPYFDVTMSPGDTRELEVEIANHGSAAITATTYATDVYTIINGGFGGRLRGEEATGATLWLDYESEQLVLDVGDRTTRTFTVTVPADAGPGEYITSLILENEDQVNEDGAIAARQVIRQAVGVVVTVPGQRSPAMDIGRATHSVVAGRSVLSVAVSNPGNVRIKPLVGVSLHDADGRTVSEASVQMDTVYAVTDTRIEVPLDALLLPGTYTVKVAADDVDQRVATSAIRSFTIEARAAPAPGAATVPGLIEVIQGDAGAFPWPAIAILVGGVLIAALGIKHSSARSPRRQTR